ncbi:hypothetical protein RND71_009581 [Anisodus tanguticus]|uniref:Uncharacterized protein n=1 Tax=Anisodus tanguticus TaxID=243964 RepID=A0AAE1VN21_9SOLA|nr:hypothetical protein RND71_009581 [Anisodus tanguticus]
MENRISYLLRAHPGQCSTLSRPIIHIYTCTARHTARDTLNRAGVTYVALAIGFPHLRPHQKPTIFFNTKMIITPSYDVEIRHFKLLRLRISIHIYSNNQNSMPTSNGYIGTSKHRIVKHSVNQESFQRKDKEFMSLKEAKFSLYILILGKQGHVKDKSISFSKFSNMAEIIAHLQSGTLRRNLNNAKRSYKCGGISGSEEEAIVFADIYSWFDQKNNIDAGVKKVIPRKLIHQM